MKKTILLVEDNRQYAEVIKLHLKGAGHKVHIAYDGETALQQIREVEPAIIFLDMMLPGIDGIVVCTKLKADPDLRKIPIVMLTGRTEMKVVNEALQAGAVDYISKADQIESIWNNITEKIERYA